MTRRISHAGIVNMIGHPVALNIKSSDVQANIAAPFSFHRGTESLQFPRNQRVWTLFLQRSGEVSVWHAK